VEAGENDQGLQPRLGWVCGAPESYGEVPDLFRASSARSSFKLPANSITPDSTMFTTSQASDPRAFANVERKPASPNC
jgi:hypothetical protein